MVFTFDPALTTDRDTVRHAIGDIEASTPLRQDETINALISVLGVTGAIVSLAEALAAEYAQSPDAISQDGRSVSWRDRVATWLNLAARHRAVLAANVIPVDTTIRSIPSVRRGEIDRPEYVRTEVGPWSP